ncbi:helicase IV, partial [Paraburkholderia nemoris]
MTKEWVPSAWGRNLTRSPDWRLSLQRLELSLTVDGKTHNVDIADSNAYSVNRGIFWTDIALHRGPSRVVKVDGLPNVRGAELTSAVEAALVEKQIREDLTYVRAAHETVL